MYHSTALLLLLFTAAARVCSESISLADLQALLPPSSSLTTVGDSVLLPIPGDPDHAESAIVLTPTALRGPHGSVVSMEGEKEGEDDNQLWRAVAVVTGVVGEPFVSSPLYHPLYHSLLPPSLL